MNAGTAIRIRAATAADIDAVHAIEVACFSDPWQREGFRDLILNGNARIVVAVDAGGRIVGYAVTYTAADEAEIANLAVTPGERRHGVGGALVDHVIADVRAGGARVAFLEVRESNTGAQALYASRGFVELSRRPRYYRNPDEDAVMMRAQFDAGGAAALG